MHRKRRTREHIIADLGVNHVERFVLQCGFVVERIRHDYGIDLQLLTFDKQGEVQEGNVLLQVKATNRLKLDQGATDFAWRIDRRDLVTWLAEPMPVILILYCARNEIAYWLYIQSYFARLGDFNLFAAGNQVTVRIRKEHQLGRAAIKKFALFRNRILGQLQELLHDDR